MSSKNWFANIIIVHFNKWFRVHENNASSDPDKWQFTYRAAIQMHPCNVSARPLTATMPPRFIPSIALNGD